MLWPKFVLGLFDFCVIYYYQYLAFLSFSAIQHPVVSVMSSSGVDVWKCAVSQCVCVSVLYDQISDLW